LYPLKTDTGANPIENQQYARHHKTEIDTEADAPLYLRRDQRDEDEASKDIYHEWKLQVNAQAKVVE
jgi:hypothetical protein